MPYMVLEFLEGQPLRDLMGADRRRRTRMPASRVVELMLPVARALARAHELGIVHRDLKPENVFVTERGPGQGARLRHREGARAASTSASRSARGRDVGDTARSER